jgi:hypothetical protein
MSGEWIEVCKTRFPTLFQGISPCDFTCGLGWKQIVEDLCSKLDAARLPALRVIQVKEKFGNLRIYLQGGNDQVSTLVEEAEALCARTCESCGAPGTKRQDDRISTLCDYCFAHTRRGPHQ